MRRFPNQDPDDRLDYGIDWSGLLRPDEAITDVTWSVAPEGLTVEEGELVGAVAVVWLSGGTVRTDYRVKCQVETDGGRRITRSVRLLVTAR